MASVCTLALGLANAGEACQLHACKGFAFSASRRGHGRATVLGARAGGGGTHTLLPASPHCLPALSKLGLPRNFVAVDHFVKCKVLAQEPFGITACEVGRVPSVRRRLVRFRRVRELPTAAELGGGRS